MVKTCSKCKVEKPVAEFSKQADSKDGLQRWCRVCASAARALHYEANKDSELAANAAWIRANKEQCSRNWKAHRVANKEARNASNKKYYWADPVAARERRKRAYWEDPAKARGSSSEYSKLNPEKGNAIRARRKANKLQATPAWADHDEIKRIYEAAGFVGYHVDHIVPLQSKLVCGLHVEHNLQALPPSKNASKGNRWWPDMPT